MVILQLALTIDGYIARTDGSVDFLDEMGSDVTEMFEQFLAGIDNIVMGRNTYDQMLTFGEVGFTDKRIIVLSSRKLDTTYEHVEQQDIDPVTLISQLSGNTWLFGGANIIHAFMKHNLVDRFELFVVPHILGEGIPLFQQVPELHTLHLVDTKSYGDNVLLIYENTSNR